MEWRPYNGVLSKIVRKPFHGTIWLQDIHQSMMRGCKEHGRTAMSETEHEWYGWVDVSRTLGTAEIRVLAPDSDHSPLHEALC